MEARRWIADAPADRPLLNFSQAAPVDPPPEALRGALAEAILSDPGAHLYGAVLGEPALREALAQHWSATAGGAVSPAQVAITAGCNQAFCTAIATLAAPGDAVLVPVPWYFNHAMWLAQSGIGAIPLPCGDDLVPDPVAAAARITDRTRAIVLVTPNNPTGAEYPAATMAAFRDLARSRGLALIVDETYRDFDSRSGPAHDLFADPDWADTVIALYSFSKAYRLTGHRTGALIAGADRLAEAEKVLDCVTICPPRTGQIGALHGLRHLGGWLAGERAEILARARALCAAMADLPDWQVLGCGAYFAYLRHPFAEASSAVARRLVAEAGVLVLPGTMFAPPGDAPAARTLRVAFANADAAGLSEMAARLARMG